MAQMAPTGSAANMMNLLKMFKGTSSTQTTGSNISQQGMDAVLQQILGSAQGLASIAGGQKAAGLYNSTTNQMLMNDFITRAAGELEKQRAGTTTVSKTAPQFGIGDIGGLLLAQGASQLLGPTVKGIGSKMGLDVAGQKLAQTLGVGKKAASASSAAGGLEAAMATDMWMYPASAAANAGFATGGSLAAGGGIDAIGAMMGAGELLGGGAGLAIGEALGTAELLGTAAATAGAASGAGAALGGWAGMAEGAVLATEAATAAGAASGTGILSGIVSFLSTVGSFIASLFSDERLKTDITQVGATYEGQPIYTYKYIDDPVRTHMGVLAQETLAYHPEAVHRHPNGALMVDYDRLLGIK